MIAIAVGCLNPLKAQKVWKEKDGVIIIEVEEAIRLPLSSQGWQLKKEPSGYTGTGFLVWKGPGNWTENNYDSLFDLTAMLPYWIDIENPGIYYINVRNYHFKEDGDNDIWISIDRGDYRKYYDWNEKEFTWCETGWNKKDDNIYSWAEIELTKGLHRVILRGRSYNFGLDRLVLHRKDTPPEKWKNPLLPSSSTYSPDKQTP